MAGFSLTREDVLPPRFTRVVVSETGTLLIEGFGAAGASIDLIHNSRKVASIQIGVDNRWKFAPRMLVGAGDHRLGVETMLAGRTGRIIGDELRVSIPRAKRNRIDIRFDEDALIRRHSEKIGEEASRVFDTFFNGKDVPPIRLAQRRQEPPRQTTSDTSDLTRDAMEWLGRANTEYQKQIIPRLQIGGGLNLPTNGQQRQRVARLQPIRVPTVDDVTQLLQSWFDRSADNYDNQIIPRLSGARASKIVISPEQEEATKAQRQRENAAREKRAREDAARASAERRERDEEERLAAVRRAQQQAAQHQAQQQTAREAQLREAREQAARAAEARRAQEQAEREAAERRAQEQAERAAAAQRATEEREIAERELERARADRERAEAERRAAEAARRNLEVATRATRQQQQEADRKSRIAEARRTNANAQAERERARKARENARRLVVERLREQRRQQQLEKEERSKRLAELWQRAKRAASDAVTRMRNRQTREKLEEDRKQDRREAVVAQREAAPATRPSTVDERSPSNSRIALNLPSQRPKTIAVRPRRVASARKATRKATKTSARRVRKRRARRRTAKVRSYHRRARTRCRHRSAWRVRLPGKYVVRKGDSLWRIARRHYRKGHRYWRIYKANRRKIRNPNLIYPCQRFSIPRRRA
ncbi:MAG: LysM peptidoglycan-binding domain-containing protein [Hyphomicrobiaceae bacterium]